MAGPFDELTQKLYDGQGVLGQFSNSMWGPSVEDKTLIAQREKEGRDQARGVQEAEAVRDLMGEVEKARNANPNLQPHELTRQLISSPDFQQKIIRLPADKITSTIQEIIKGTQRPEPTYQSVPAGQSMVQMQPGQSPKSVFTAPTPTQQDAEYAASLTPEKRAAIAQGQVAIDPQKGGQGTAQERALNNMVATKAISPRERDQVLSGTQRIEVLKDQLTGRPTGHIIIDKATGNPIRQFDYKPDGTYNMIDFGARNPLNPEAQAVQGVQGTPVPHPATPGGIGAPPPGTYPGQDGRPLPPDPQQGRTGMPPLPGQQGQAPQSRRKIDMVDAVGVAGTGTGILGGFAGQLDSRLSAEELNQKRNDLGFFRAHVNALKDNKEFASEVKAREAITPGMWDISTNPLNAARVFESWYNLAEDKIKTANRVLGDPRFSATAKREAEQSLLWAERTIQMIGPKEELQQKIRELQDNKGGVGVREAMDIARGAVGAATNPYARMSEQDLVKVDVNTLSPAQLGQFKEAIQAAKQKRGR